VFTYSDKEFNYDVSWQQFNKQSQLSRVRRLLFLLTLSTLESTRDMKYCHSSL